MKSHLLPIFIFYRSSGEKLTKFQANSPCLIMSVILMTTLFYKAIILQGEIWCWSLLGIKGLNPRSYAREKPLLAARYKTKTLTGKFICIRRSALLKTATMERKSARGSTSKRKQYSRSMRLLVDCFFFMYISSKIHSGKGACTLALVV